MDAHERPTVGDTKTSVMPDDHKGWLKCDGRSLKTKDFYFLFQVIQYSFGGAGGSFNLPKPAGTVPGIVGTGVDRNSRPFTLNLGEQVGEYVHTLLMAEMPVHNHGVALSLGQIAGNNKTSEEITEISVNINTTGVYDAGHAHNYTQPGGARTYNTLGADQNAGTSGGTTNIGYASIGDTGHNHSITDPKHDHTINPAGGGD